MKPSIIKNSPQQQHYRKTIPINFTFKKYQHEKCITDLRIDNDNGTIISAAK